MSAPAAVGQHASRDVVVVGGGFYGVRIAAMLAAEGRSVLLLEREPRFLSRASFRNQARVHGGYHYPRSVLTALRARVHYERFSTEFAAAIDGEFHHLYAIARQQSRVRAGEFVEFCRRIDAPVERAPSELAARFDAEMVEGVFLVEEAAFDAHRLADQAMAAAIAAGAECLAESEALAVAPGMARRLALSWRRGGVDQVTETDWIIAATYSDLNELPRRSGLAPVGLIHELTEIALVDPPAVLRGHGVTVMDGPFWSCIPFPSLGVHSLTHVRYTPHTQRLSSESDGAAEALRPDSAGTGRQSHAVLMQRDAARFMPAMREARYRGSLWETKTVLPRSAGDDSRPILVRQHDDAPGLVSVLGGKIDSVYDVEDELRALVSAS